MGVDAHKSNENMLLLKLSIYSFNIWFPSAALTSLEAERIEIESKKRQKACYSKDMAAIIRNVVKTFETFRALAIMILREIPSQYSDIYRACDSYKDHSVA